MSARLPPPLPSERPKPQQTSSKQTGCLTRAAVILFIILAALYGFNLIKEDLQTPEGRHELLNQLLTLLASHDTYLIATIGLLNLIAYIAILKRLYPTAARARHGFYRAILAVKGDPTIPPHYEGSEFAHFFIIFILPILFIAATKFEYQLLDGWLHSWWGNP